MRKLPVFDLSTPCSECGYRIQPDELMRTGWDTVLCPQCKRESKLPEPKKGYST
jgi:hypothetical protein